MLLGTFLCLLILVAILALASRWPALFWLLVISFCLCMLFAPKVDIEFRFGVGGCEEKRIYGLLVWKRRARVPESADTHESARLEVGTARRDG
jgi:hypothetical protein